MRRTRRPKSEWIWEEVAALRRGRPEPETPEGEETTAAAARRLHGALAVSVEPEREECSRRRLLEAIRAETPAEVRSRPRGLNEPMPARSRLAAAGEVLVCLALAAGIGVAGWYSPRWAGWLMRPAPFARQAAQRCWENPLYLGSIHLLSSDRSLREEFGSPNRLLKGN